MNIIEHNTFQIYAVTLPPSTLREALAALKEAFSNGADSVSSCARWLKYLLKDFSAIVIENSALTRTRLINVFILQQLNIN